MRWVIGVVWIAVAFFAWALCKAAGDAERREEQYWTQHGIRPDDGEPA